MYFIYFSTELHKTYRHGLPIAPLQGLPRLKLARREGKHLKQVEKGGGLPRNRSN